MSASGIGFGNTMGAPPVANNAGNSTKIISIDAMLDRAESSRSDRNEETALRRINLNLDTNGQRATGAFKARNLRSLLGAENFAAKNQDLYRDRIEAIRRADQPLTKAMIQRAIDHVNHSVSSGGPAPEAPGENHEPSRRADNTAGSSIRVSNEYRRRTSVVESGLNRISQNLDSYGAEFANAFRSPNLVGRLGIENFNDENHHHYRDRIGAIRRADQPLTKAMIQQAIDHVNRSVRSGGPAPERQRENREPGGRSDSVSGGRDRTGGKTDGTRRETINPAVSEAIQSHSTLRDWSGKSYDYKRELASPPSWQNGLSVVATSVDGKVKFHSGHDRETTTVKQSFDHFYHNNPNFKAIVDELINRFGEFNIVIADILDGKNNLRRGVAGDSNGNTGNYSRINKYWISNSRSTRIENPSNDLGRIGNNIGHLLVHEMFHNLGYMHTDPKFDGTGRWQFTNLTMNRYDELVDKVFE